MPNPITFHVQCNLENPHVHPWEIHIYPVQPFNATAPPAWKATMTSQGLCMQSNGITQYVTWAGLSRLLDK